jgi:malate dehydrogenase (oxaloacetate-decarboxylating)
MWIVKIGLWVNRYPDQLCTFNDDIQGTAAVAVGTLLSAITVTGTPLKEQRIAAFGFGEAGLAISQPIASGDAGYLSENLLSTSMLSR